MPTDAELVAAVLTAEQAEQSGSAGRAARGGHAGPRTGPVIGADAALAEIYDRYADRLHDLFLSALGDTDAAADGVRDTFVLAVRRMSGMPDPSALWPLLRSTAGDVVAVAGEKTVEGRSAMAEAGAPALLRADVLARAALRRPPADKGKRMSLAVAGAAALLVAGGVVIWSARTDPPAIPASTRAPSPATTTVSEWVRDGSGTGAPTRLTVTGCGAALTSDC
ncbi:hypothetical protein BAY61_01190 [Prauserella marina]|uniref:Uncharacterized protein n=1 Tax=Prauserella marina TaxID=530584 RepID=A0A222VIT8_9PSEU|nr:hypothetical protein [Prauserella marina]ASR33830.1 hypothetical protein BAY61_01190 [Prauserella marina]PWV82413.1 hypothetical protein DES30_102654 [Prauserella marina]SDC68561.1 hypothetical protein SAMN05421630_103190 [Prauserella marina]